METVWGIGWFFAATIVFLGKKHETGRIDEKIFLAFMMCLWPIILPILFIGYMRNKD